MPSTNETVEHVHQQVHSVNPFMKQDEYSRRSIAAYKICTAASWLLVVATSIYYTFKRPDGRHHEGRTIWDQNRAHHTPFTMSSIILSIYWSTLYILQVGYCWHLYANNTTYVQTAANVGSHFVLHNILLFGFIHLWVRSHFFLAETLLIINFLNLTAAYFRHPKTPRFIHIPVVSGPLAWNFVALYWCGAAVINSNHLVARIFANIAIWGILTYGLFFLIAFNDFSMGFELSVLCAAVGVTQFLAKIVALQWIFAFVIMSVLFVLSTVVALPSVFGEEPFKRAGRIVSDDRERAPLLADD